MSVATGVAEASATGKPVEHSVEQAWLNERQPNAGDTDGDASAAKVDTDGGDGTVTKNAKATAQPDSLDAPARHAPQAAVPVEPAVQPARLHNCARERRCNSDFKRCCIRPHRFTLDWFGRTGGRQPTRPSR